jgi:hypothetical protein
MAVRPSGRRSAGLGEAWPPAISQAVVEENRELYEPVR